VGRWVCRHWHCFSGALFMRKDAVVISKLVRFNWNLSSLAHIQNDAFSHCLFHVLCIASWRPDWSAWNAG
jgi:hypothetical protein